MIFDCVGKTILFVRVTFFFSVFSPLIFMYRFLFLLPSFVFAYTLPLSSISHIICSLILLHFFDPSFFHRFFCCWSNMVFGVNKKRKHYTDLLSDRESKYKEWWFSCNKHYFEIPIDSTNNQEKILSRFQYFERMCYSCALDSLLNCSSTLKLIVPVSVVSTWAINMNRTSSDFSIDIEQNWKIEYKKVCSITTCRMVHTFWCLHFWANYYVPAEWHRIKSMFFYRPKKQSSEWNKNQRKFHKMHIKTSNRVLLLNYSINIEIK